MQLRSVTVICLLIAACKSDTNNAPSSAATAGVPAPMSTAGSAPPTAAGTGALPAGAGATISTAGSPGASGSRATAGMGGSVAQAGAGGSATQAGAGGSATQAGASGSATQAGAGGSGGSMAGAAAAGSAGMSTSAGAGGASGSGGAPATTLMGCGESKLLPLPEDLTARGPWPVGQKTVKIGRLNTVEIMYPAKPGSEQGKEVLKYDMRIFLPAGEEKKVPDAEASFVDEMTYRDLPLDDAHGPYPVAIFVHGTASFRIGSFSTQALWASRGFVVVAADHPGLYLGDYLAQQYCGRTGPAQDLSADVDAEIAALAAPSGELAFLADHIDAKRIAIAGHSAGAYAAATFSTKPGVQMIMPLSGTRAVARSSTLKSVLFVSGIADSVLPYRPGGFGVGSLLYPGSGTAAYDDSPGPPNVKKRITGITGGGHLVVTDLCRTGPQGKATLDVAASHGVCGASQLSSLGLADCGMIAREKGIKIVNDVTTGALEETLHCQDRATQLSALKTRYPEVGDFKEATK